MPKHIGQPGTGQRRQGRSTTFRECDLKICELCGWLNLESNEECVICGWHGRFERDPHVVHAAVELAVRQHGRLELQHLTDIDSYHKPSSGGLIKRWVRWMRSLMARIRRA